MPDDTPQFKYLKLPIRFRNTDKELRITYTQGGASKTLGHGQAVTFSTACAAAEYIESSYYVHEGPPGSVPILTKAAIVEDSNATRYELDELCRYAQQHCSSKCGDVVWTLSTPAQSPQEGEANAEKKKEDSGEAQGAPQPAPATAAAPDPAAPAPTDQPPGPVYGPPAEETTKEPNARPFSGEASSTTTQGGDPVDLFSGAFSIHEADLVVPNTVLPLVLTRFYKSGHPYPGPFSWNWDHNHNIHLRELGTTDPGGVGNVARWNGNLHEDIFTWDGKEFQAPRGVFQKLEKLSAFDPDGDYVIHDVGGLRWLFRRPDNWVNPFRIPLDRVVDRFGNTLQYDYDSDDRLWRVTCKPVDAEGNTAAGPYHYLEFIYGDCGLLECVSDSLGRSVEYWHDPDVQHLLKVRYPGTADHPDGTERVYHYGALHLPEMLRHSIVRVEDGQGKVYVENFYEDDPSAWSYGHLVRQIHGGNPFQFRYTSLQWLPSRAEYINVPTQRTEVADPEGGITTYTFNYRGDMLDRRTRLSKDGSYWITAVAFEYDAQGSQIRSQQMRDFEESAEGNLVHLWGVGEAREYHPGHPDPRMRGMVRKVERLDGTMRELAWEGTYDPDLQLLLSEHGPAGDGFQEAALTTTYQYRPDNKGKLAKIVHPVVTLPDGGTQSAAVEFEVNGRGQTTAVITAEGIRHELLYDESPGLGMGRLLKKVADAGSGGVAAEQGFSYDHYGFLATMTDPTGAITRYIYNALGQIEQVVQPEIDGSAPTTIMHYDGDGLVTEVLRPRGDYADGVIQGDHIVDRIVRNILGHVVDSEIGANTESPRRTKRIVDHRGLPLRSTDPLGTVSRWYWDERGLLFRHEVKGYDGAHTQERYVYTRDGRLEREIHGDARDTVTEYIYGPFGRLSRIQSLHRASDGPALPAGPTARRYWSERGYMERSELRVHPGTEGDELLARTEFRYDARGRLVERAERPFSADAPFDDATTPRLATTFYYDADDRLVKVVDHRGAVTTYAYDGVNRLVEMVDPEGNRVLYSHSFAERSVEVQRYDLKTDGTPDVVKRWKHRSDARGRVVERIEPDGASSRFEYDDRNLMIATIDRDGTRHEYVYGALNELLADTLDPSGLNIINERSYDLTGRMIAYKDPSGQITTYGYDGLGRLVESLKPGEPAPSRMTYGADGRLAVTTMPSGLSLDYSYDVAGRLASMRASNLPAGVEPIPQHSYTYDPVGRLMTATAGTSVITRAYDSLGRLLRETSHGDTLEAAYDDLAGTVTRSWPDGRRELLTANLNGMVMSIERTASGALGRGGARLGDFLPYGSERLGAATLLGGIDAAIEYDERMRVNRIRYEKGGSSIEKVTYRYDTLDHRCAELLDVEPVQSRLHAFDKRRRLTRTREGSAVVALGTDGRTQDDNDDDIRALEAALNTQIPAPTTYEYLFTQVSGGRADERLTFRKTDPANGLTTRQYSYAGGHRVATADGESFTHLSDGTRRSDAANRYEVDALGRVLRVTDPGGTTKMALQYDALGRVTSIMSESGGGRALSYFGGALWQERDAAGPARQFSHHPGLPGPLAAHVAGETYVMHHDARMNLLAVTDSAGDLQQRYRYEPFGLPSAGSSPTGIEPRFGGLRWLDDVGLYLGGARMMDPHHGLWLSPDPLGYVDSPHLYAYAAQNPIDYMDPSGLSTGKGGGGASSDGGSTGTGGGGWSGGTPRTSAPGGKSQRSIAYGPGDGPGISAPTWILDTVDVMRNLSNGVRDMFGRAVDSTLGKLGVVGEFLGGALKRIFDYSLMLSPYGFAVLEEELGGMASMYGMTVDAIFNPDPSRYERLGKMISGMPEYFAHMSASEWGSLTVDVALSLVTEGEALAEIGERAGARILGRLQKFLGRSVRSVGGLRDSPMRILTAEEIIMVQREFEAIGGDISMLRFNEGAQTGFLDKSGVIQIRGDIFPHPEALNHPRSVMSPRAVLAHEYYGHAAYRGTKLAPGAWNDEFRASYRAALDAPGLSEIDQQHLMLDAIERAREARVRIKRNQFIIGIIGEY